jgi:hypothetical protein
VLLVLMLEHDVGLQVVLASTRATSAGPTPSSIGSRLLVLLLVLQLLLLAAAATAGGQAAAVEARLAVAVQEVRVDGEHGPQVTYLRMALRSNLRAQSMVTNT